MDQIHHIRELFYQQGMNISEISSVTSFNWKMVKKYVSTASHGGTRWGSPPHMRGKGGHYAESRHEDRITPAHAGKSLPPYIVEQHFIND